MKKKIWGGTLKSPKNGVGSGVGSRSVLSTSQRYGSEDPDPHQNVTDPQHWIAELQKLKADSGV
jgi:hypothetical protein